MKSLVLLVAVVFAGLLNAAETVTLPIVRELSCDVLVVGGGPAGLSAAVCASRHGAKTILAERNGYLGGMATAGLVGPFMTATTPKGEVQLIRGFFDEFVRTMEEKGGAIHPMKAKIGSFSSYRANGHYGMTTFDPEVFKSVAEQKCREAGVELCYHLLFVKAEVGGGRMTAAYFATKSGIWKIVAKNYIDCTGDGDVAFSAGVPTVYGDGQGDVQASSLFFRIRGVDKAKMDAHDADCRARKDWNAQFYVNEIKAARAAGEFPIWRQKVEVYEGLDGNWIVNMGQSENVDGTDPKQVTEAEITGREQARIIVAFLRKYVRGCENCELAQTGPVEGRMFGTPAVVRARYGEGEMLVFNCHPEMFPKSRFLVVAGIRALTGRDIRIVCQPLKPRGAERMAFLTGKLDGKASVEEYFRLRADPDVDVVPMTRTQLDEDWAGRFDCVVNPREFPNNKEVKK